MAREMEFKSLFFCVLNCLEVMECRLEKGILLLYREPRIFLFLRRTILLVKGFNSKMVDLRVVF